MWIVERSLRKESPIGEIKNFLVRIGVPHKREDDWSCALEIGGLDGSPFERTHTLHGVDGWQAVTLSMDLARRALEWEIENGSRILYVDTDEDFDLDFMYPTQPSNA